MQPGILVEVPGRHEQRIHPECSVAPPELGKSMSLQIAMPTSLVPTERTKNSLPDVKLASNPGMRWCFA